MPRCLSSCGFLMSCEKKNSTVLETFWLVLFSHDTMLRLFPLEDNCVYPPRKFILGNDKHFSSHKPASDSESSLCSRGLFWISLSPRWEWNLRVQRRYCLLLGNIKNPTLVDSHRFFFRERLGLSDKRLSCATGSSVDHVNMTLR